MKNILLIGCLILSPFILKAQQVDDKIYENCQTSLDKDIIGDQNIIFDACPEPQKGLNDFFKYILSHIHNPKSQAGTQGRLIVRVIIEKNGDITNATVIRGLNNEINKEVLRVISQSPKWKPAVLKKKPVRCYYYVPLTIELQSS